MELTVKLQNLDKVQRQLQKLRYGELQAAAAAALNDVAFDMRRALTSEMGRVFDRPTPYVLKSVLVKRATADKLVATVAPTYLGGKGVDPQKVLAANVAGGARRDKRSEVALRRVGILPDGYVTAIPKRPYPGSDDGRGNIRGPFLVQLLSYLQAFGEQGYKANMTEKRRQALAKQGTTASGFRTINGVQYFVSYGRLRSGKTGHLAPGIWARRGIHGSIVAPVLMFVKTPTYRKLLDLDQLVDREKVQAKFESRLRYRIRKAVEDLGR